MGIFTVMGILMIGIAIGYFFRHQRTIFPMMGKVNMYVIYLLLFAMGLSVGGNKSLLDNLHYLGQQAAIISIAATLGSVIFSWIVYHFLFRRKE